MTHFPISIDFIIYQFDDDGGTILADTEPTENLTEQDKKEQEEQKEDTTTSQPPNEPEVSTDKPSQEPIIEPEGEDKQTKEKDEVSEKTDAVEAVETSDTSNAGETEVKTEPKTETKPDKADSTEEKQEKKEEPKEEPKDEKKEEPKKEEKPKTKGTDDSKENEKQDKKEKSGKKKSDKPAENKEKGKPEEENPDFKYIIRVANTNLDGNSTVPLGLTGIKGIGIRLGSTIADKLGLPRSKRLGDLTDEEEEKLGKIIEDIENQIPAWMKNRQKDFETGEDLHIISSEIQRQYRDDLNLLKKIRCYRGIRHEQGQKVRGQRTRANGRSGMTVGVQRRKMQQQKSKK